MAVERGMWEVVSLEAPLSSPLHGELGGPERGAVLHPFVGFLQP